MIVFLVLSLQVYRNLKALMFICYITHKIMQCNNAKNKNIHSFILSLQVRETLPTTLLILQCYTELRDDLFKMRTQINLLHKYVLSRCSSLQINKIKMPFWFKIKLSINFVFKVPSSFQNHTFYQPHVVTIIPPTSCSGIHMDC